MLKYEKLKIDTVTPFKKVENQKLKQIFTKDENSLLKLEENNSKYVGDKM